MAHLTMGELVPGSGQILADPFSSSMARLAQIRRIPGYGQNVLQKFGAALEPTVLDGEILRLKILQEQALAPDPIASAFNALKNAYEEHDQFNIQRWEDAVERSGARRWLNGVRAMAAKDRSLGYTTAGFWDGRGMSGLGQYTFRRTRRGMINVYDTSGFQVGTVSEARARQMARAQAPSRYQRTRTRWAAQRREYSEFRRLAETGQLPPGVRSVRALRRYRQQEARAERRARSREERRAARAARPSREERRRRQEDIRERSRLRREEESGRQDGYTDDQLEKIRDNPSAPAWQRRMAERKLARRAYEALQAGRPKRKRKKARRVEGWVFPGEPRRVVRTAEAVPVVDRLLQLQRKSRALFEARVGAGGPPLSERFTYLLQGMGG